MKRFAHVLLAICMVLSLVSCDMLFGPCSSGHDYEESIITEATCADEGVKKLTCSKCGDEKTEKIEKLPHDFDEGRIAIAPGCTTKGEFVYTCSFCGEIESEELPANEHDWGEVETVDAASCGEVGRGKETCKNCTTYHFVELPATGDHTYGDPVVTIPATCIKGRNDYECSVCGHKKSEDIPPVTTEHTFTEDNLSEEYRISKATIRCGAIYSKSCKFCGAKSDETFVFGDKLDYINGVFTIDSTGTKAVFAKANLWYNAVEDEFYFASSQEKYMVV